MHRGIRESRMHENSSGTTEPRLTQQTTTTSAALTLAAYFGHMACVEALLEHETVDIHTCEKDKDHAIHYASMEGHNGILVKLIEKGADVDLLKDPMAERRFS